MRKRALPQADFNHLVSELNMKRIAIFLRYDGVLISLFFPILILFALFSPVTVDSHGGEDPSQLELPTVTANRLPGVTWADDIHPIFIRNKCYKCHTRGKEDTVKGLTEFALGIVDANDPANPYYSFHELVYTEGSPNIIDGEVLRGGQCCWPRSFKSDQQRRIWLGHPERSALLRKLDRDYYDWNKPPRYLEEGLRLTWGLPMPLWAVEDQKTSHESSLDPSLWKEIVLRAMLMIGHGKDRLFDLEKAIPAVDRALIREWINNTVQLQMEGTAINIRLAPGGRPVVGKEITLIGNFVVSSHTKIQETFIANIDDSGIASLEFPVGSVVSRTWYAGILDEQANYHYQAINIVPGEINELTMNE